MFCSAGDKKDFQNGMWKMIREKLQAKGIDFDSLCSGHAGDARMKVVCVSPDLKESVEEMGQATRDQTVMVRIDEESSKMLDQWMETGYVKSRSEAAALFIREGLKVRASELEKLRDLIKQVETARKRLRKKAEEVFGENNQP